MDGGYGISANITMKKEKMIKKIETAKIPENKVKLTSFTLGAVIPTERYGNLQASITVEAHNIEEANNYIMPYLNHLRDENSENRPIKNINQPGQIVKNEPKGFVKVDPKANTIPMPPRQTAEQLKEFLENDTPAAHYMSEPFKKAKQAIDTCMTADALSLIEKQVIKSTKLKPEEKTELDIIIINKKAALAGK